MAISFALIEEVIHMSFNVKKNTITLTRGDTFKAVIGITNPDGTPYEPDEGDTIRFAMKKDYNDETVLVEKNIPTDTLILTLEPSDTKPLEFGDYVYDIQLTKYSGEIDTFITKSKLILTEEVE